MELLIKDLVEVKPIEFNYEELKQELTANLGRYESMIYSEDNIKSAKEDRANLNKLSKALDERRKEIKKDFMKPYTEFEEKIKDLITLVDKTSKKVDSQVKFYEDKTKQEKKDIIKAIYDENIGELKKLVSFEKLFKDKWLNVSESLSKVSQELMEEIERIKQEYGTLQKVIAGDPSEEQLKMFFFSILSLERTLAQKEIVEAERQKLKEIEASNRQVTKTADNELKELKFRVLATNKQLKLLSEFLINNNIKYGRV